MKVLVKDKWISTKKQDDNKPEENEPHDNRKRQSEDLTEKKIGREKTYWSTVDEYIGER